MNKKAIVIGASSGIGEAIVYELDQRGYQVGITARRTDLLDEIAAKCNNRIFVRNMDAMQHKDARIILQELIAEMDGVDVFIYNAGVGGKKNDHWEYENAMHQINAVGFANLASYMFTYFRDNDLNGHIAGVSSIVGLRGLRHDNGYGATKAFMYNYMQGLRHKASHGKHPIHVTDIRPGFIDTDMTKDLKVKFLVRPADIAAHQIVKAIENRRKVAYITKRYWLIAQAIKYYPTFLWNRL